jgi:hypothetical protein
MRLQTIVIASASMTALVSVAAAQSGPSCADLVNVGKPGVLYYKPAQLNASAPAGWAPLPGTIMPSTSGQALQLSYIVPARHTADEAGALVVKIARTGTPGSVDNTIANFHIRLYRPEVTTTCKGRYAWDYLSWSGNLVRPQVDSTVYAADYLYYHKTTSDAGQSTIYGFHFDYRDRAGQCVATDDKKNGNREQFLFEDRERDNSLVVANIKRNLSAVAEAFAAPEFIKEVLQDKRLAEAFAKYQAYTQLETQLYPYKYPDAACVAFTVQNVQKGETLLVTLNNLEQRAVNGRFLPASSRREDQVTVKVQ